MPLSTALELRMDISVCHQQLERRGEGGTIVLLAWVWQIASYGWILSSLFPHRCWNIWLWAYKAIQSFSGFSLNADGLQGPVCLWAQTDSHWSVLCIVDSLFPCSALAEAPSSSILTQQTTVIMAAPCRLPSPSAWTFIWLDVLLRDT